MTLLRRYRYANTSRLRRETLSAVPHGGDPQDRTASLQRWIHRNALASLCLCGTLFRNLCVSPSNKYLMMCLSLS
ncbi:hypothetical protein [Nostoc sp.]|uniref:hypothetical protein n=1 Tax=Nostoc sp. TaxID=1180 RepID=UPI002FF53D2E